MSEDQDYKVLKTPEKKVEVKVRNYTTGADEEALLEVVTKASDTTVEGEGPDAKKSTKVDSGVVNELTRLKVSRFVVSVNGVEEGRVEAVYKLRTADYRYVVKFLDELTKDLIEGFGLEDEEKKA